MKQIILKNIMKTQTIKKILIILLLSTVSLKAQYTIIPELSVQTSMSAKLTRLDYFGSGLPKQYDTSVNVFKIDLIQGRMINEKAFLGVGLGVEGLILGPYTDVFVPIFFHYRYNLKPLHIAGSAGYSFGDAYTGSGIFFNIGTAYHLGIFHIGAFYEYQSLTGNNAVIDNYHSIGIKTGITLQPFKK